MMYIRMIKLNTSNWILKIINYSSGWRFMPVKTPVRVKPLNMFKFVLLALDLVKVGMQKQCDYTRRVMHVVMVNITIISLGYIVISRTWSMLCSATDKWINFLRDASVFRQSIVCTLENNVIKIIIVYYKVSCYTLW